jgi:hypothetical protein
MEKIINLLIKEFIEGADTYTHNGSIWLIFTESKQWVIELTKEKTLWYNYTFFKEVFEYTSMDVVENQQYITKWVENNIIKDAKEIKSDDFNVSQHLCEDVINEGVKKTKGAHMKTDWSVEDTIENGIKETIECDWNIPKYVINEVVNDGVKETNHVDVMGFFDNKMENTLQNGVKETNPWNDSIIGDLNQNGCIDNVIENGVNVSGTFVGGKKQKENIESVIGYGTKNPTD